MSQHQGARCRSRSRADAAGFCLTRCRRQAPSAMGNTQTVYLPPWVPSTEAEKVNETEFREAIIKLSAAAANLIAPHPLVDDPEFNFDWVEHRPFAEAAYRGDKRLHRLLPKLVPKRISEEDFWRNYFSHVFAVKRRFELGEPSAPPMDAPPTCSTVGPGGASATPMDTPATGAPASPGQSRLGMTVSYPEKFHLALKYAAEGPPLPNLSDADRILLEALQQQATVGECNQPRPGMWDSAEEKVSQAEDTQTHAMNAHARPRTPAAHARTCTHPPNAPSSRACPARAHQAKYEAWKKLGSMSRAEAMHLYVEAIEGFQPSPTHHPVLIPPPPPLGDTWQVRPSN